MASIVSLRLVGHGDGVFDEGVEKFLFMSVDAMWSVCYNSSSLGLRFLSSVMMFSSRRRVSMGSSSLLKWWSKVDSSMISQII